MESLTDKTLLVAASLIVFLVEPVNAVSIGLLLGTFSIAMIVELCSERIGVWLLVISLFGACAFPEMALFFAPISYACTRMRFKWLHGLWIVAPVLTLWRLPFNPWIISSVLDLVACFLALRCNALLNERRQYRVLRDGLREQSIQLEARNRLLADMMGDNGAPAKETHIDSSEETSSAGEFKLSLSLSSLTERELEIAAYVAQGLDNREIASRVFASEGTVRNHISSILQKSGLRNRTQIAVAYLCSLEA